MLVLKYRHYPDRIHTKKLIQKHKMNPIIIKDLPRHGMIALYRDEPVAIGFIREMEGSYAMLDSFMTNPDMPSELRSRALDLIITKLTSWATTNGITKILAITRYESLVERCKSLGYNHIEEMSILVK